MSEFSFQGCNRAEQHPAGRPGDAFLRESLRSFALFGIRHRGGGMTTREARGAPAVAHLSVLGHLQHVSPGGEASFQGAKRMMRNE